MNTSELTAAAQEALADRESTGKAVVSIAVGTSPDASGGSSYAGRAVVTYHDGTTASLNIADTALSAALERHANDQAELGLVASVVIPVPLPTVPPNNLVSCEEHSGYHIETVACRWPHNTHPDGPEPQVGHPLLVTD